jgi:hypothetical protein
MLYGFTGAHRSGKSTLAKTVAEELSIHYHATSTTEVAKMIGINPVAPMTLIQRVQLQEHLLKVHCQQLENLPRPLIVDRTPLDYLAYLLAEFPMGSERLVGSEVLDAASRYRTMCLEMIRQYYDGIFYLAPLPTYEVAEDKPAENRAYQDHVDLLILGSLAAIRENILDCRLFFSDFEARREAVHDLIVGRLDSIDQQRRSTVWIQ